MIVHASEDDFNLLVQEGMTFFPEASWGQVSRALVDAVNALSKHAPIHRSFPLTVQAGVTDYPMIDNIEPWIISSVEWVKYGDVCLPTRSECGTCQSLSWEFEDEDYLQIYTPQEDSSDRFVVRAALALSSGACVVPAKYVRRYREALMFSMKAKMHYMTNMPWTDLRVAGALDVQADARMIEARTHEATKGKRGLQIQYGERVL